MDTFMELEQAEKKGQLPKILVPVHLTGSSCDMEAIGKLADRYGFDVIEETSLFNLIDFLWKSSKVRGNKVSIPLAPVAA